MGLAVSASRKHLNKQKHSASTAADLNLLSHSFVCLQVHIVQGCCEIKKKRKKWKENMFFMKGENKAVIF